jgi:2-dehydro-3-deoxyphosphogluconate aldolase/(4S)-4-hydroxy-2-oxoglutarate aldolase
MRSADALAWMKRSRIVPVIRAADPETAYQVAMVLSEAGIDVFEVTTTVPEAPDVIARLRAELRDRALVGAGTVLDARTASVCIAQGAQFVVAPNTDVSVASACHTRDVLWVPGALTPTEIASAHTARATLIKVFPAGAVGGPAYIRSIKAPFPELDLMPTGGVDLTNVKEYLEAGACCVGVGSDLVDVRLLETEPERLREQAHAYLAAAL